MFGLDVAGFAALIVAISGIITAITTYVMKKRNADLSEFKSLYETMKKQIDSLQQRVDKLEGQLEDEREENAKLKAENIVLKGKIEMLETNKFICPAIRDFKN